MRVLCVAGFLGSGKTTVLLEVAHAMVEQGAGLAVIENEVGEVGVDAEIVRDQELPVLELFGGCICCTLRAGLVDALREVGRRYDPDWVLVEATGLAVPGDIVPMVREHLPDIGAVRVLTVVDAVRWQMLKAVLGPLVTAQLESADVVAINKADEASDAILAAVEEDVGRLTSADVVVRIAAARRRGIGTLLRALA